jgi:hypothetical protein
METRVPQAPRTQAGFTRWRPRDDAPYRGSFEGSCEGTRFLSCSSWMHAQGVFARSEMR